MSKPVELFSQRRNLVPPSVVKLIAGGLAGVGTLKKKNVKRILLKRSYNQHDYSDKNQYSTVRENQDLDAGSRHGSIKARSCWIEEAKVKI